jgi:hypothetical protein
MDPTEDTDLKPGTLSIWETVVPLKFRTRIYLWLVELAESQLQTQRLTFPQSKPTPALTDWRKKG